MDRNEQLFDRYADDYATVRLLDEYGLEDVPSEERRRKDYASEFKSYVSKYHGKQDENGYWHVAENLAVLLDDLPEAEIAKMHPELGAYMDDARDLQAMNRKFMAENTGIPSGVRLDESLAPLSDTGSPDCGLQL